MEVYELDHDIKLLTVTVTSFPNGIMDAFERLHMAIQGSKDRGVFGISYQDQSGTIIYKAAAVQLDPGESELKGLEAFTVPKGNYLSIYIQDFMKDVKQIGNAFNQLLSKEGIDKSGFCMEMYVGKKDVRCMVKLK